MGPVVTVPAYNVNGVPDPETERPDARDIFLGNITRWDDPAIAKLNPGVNLPSTKITPVYRSDGSGDTYAFTDYLSTVSPEFKSKVGTSTTVKFPTGVGAEKNDGVAAAIGQTDGSIGYVGLAYALSNELSMPRSKTRPGISPNRAWKALKPPPTRSARFGPNNEISLADLPASAKAPTRSRPTPT